MIDRDDFVGSDVDELWGSAVWALEDGAGCGLRGWKLFAVGHSSTSAPEAQRTNVFTIFQAVSFLDRSNIHSRDAICTGRVPMRG